MPGSGKKFQRDFLVSKTSEFRIANFGLPIAELRILIFDWCSLK